MMRLILAALAGLVALAGFANFFAAMNGQSPIPIAISHPLAIVAVVYLLFQHIFPAMIYRMSVEARSRSIRTVEASGGVLAHTICGGAIGKLRFRGPLLRVAVHPGGILIMPFLMPAIAIQRDEITAIALRKRWFAEVLEIQHQSAAFVSPIRLGCGAGDPVVRILRPRDETP
jgi:hypothetical protein